MSIPFESIASQDWIHALGLAKVGMGTGVRDGAEVVFENPFERDGKRHSFRFLPAKQCFMDHHRAGPEMCVTPEAFVARALGISGREAWELLRRAKGEWVENPRQLHNGRVLASLGFGGLLKVIEPQVHAVLESETAAQGASVADLRSLEACFANEHFRRTTALRTEFARRLIVRRRDRGFVPHPNALAWWESRGFEARALSGLRQHVVLLDESGASELESIATELGWGTEQRIASTLWQPTAEGGVRLRWIGNDCPVLFFCWSPFRDNFRWSYSVTGVRVRRGVSQGDGPKELVLSSKFVSGLDRFPASLGLYCWLGAAEGDCEVSQGQLDRGDGWTVVLTEGVTDALAGRQLLCLEQGDAGCVGKRRIAFVSAGQIQCARWKGNLDLIRSCSRLVIAFNNDASGMINTGQTLAKELRDAAVEYGLQRVELLPTECLEGCNDLNDLLKKRIKEKASGAPRGYMAFRPFSLFIGE